MKFQKCTPQAAYIFPSHHGPSQPLIFSSATINHIPLCIIAPQYSILFKSSKGQKISYVPFPNSVPLPFSYAKHLHVRCRFERPPPPPNIMMQCHYRRRDNYYFNQYITVLVRNLEPRYLQTILDFALYSPSKIETHLLGFCRPCQCVLPP